jgi:hypothetical protein
MRCHVVTLQRNIGGLRERRLGGQPPAPHRRISDDARPPPLARGEDDILGCRRWAEAQGL